MDLPKFINEEKLSELTGKSISTLQQDRGRGIGVPTTKLEVVLDIQKLMFRIIWMVFGLRQKPPKT